MAIIGTNKTQVDRPLQGINEIAIVYIAASFVVEIMHNSFAQLESVIGYKILIIGAH